MRAYVAAALVILFLTPAFAGRNIMRDAWKLGKKLQNDSNVVEVRTDYVDHGWGGHDEFAVVVKNCYNTASTHRIPSWYKGTEVRIHCIVPTEK